MTSTQVEGGTAGMIGELAAKQRIAELEMQLRDEALAFNHANEIVGKLEAKVSELEKEVERLTKELAFRDFAQARASDIALAYGPYDEIQKSLSSEIALHAAWTKRATEAELATLRAQVESMNALLNTPEIEDFDKAVPLEAAHQVKRWGTEHDEGKLPSDWFWLVGYLAGKAFSFSHCW